MLSGRAAFSGATVPDILAAVLGRDPDWDALPAATDPSLVRLIRRCLQKDLRRRLRDIADSRDDLEDAIATAARAIPATAPPREVEFRRITDFRSRKESPAVSPDGKMAAFVAVIGGRRQIWIRFLAGGSALQITRDDVDHEQPRWAPDSSRLIYYTPAPVGGRDGTIWEISALGGAPRRVTTATCGGDISRDGQRVAVLQAASGGVALVTMARDGSQVRRVLFLPDGFTYTSPRWSPDGRMIAISHASNVAWEQCLDLVSVGDGERRMVVRNDWLRGFTWRPDGTGIVYSSSRGSTVRYPPTFNLRTVDCDGSGDWQLTFGDHSYVDPDAYSGTALLTARVTSQSDVWRFPTDGTPSDNVHHAVRVTDQTAQVQTPSPSPDDSEVVYLSDSGGHGNLWIARTDGAGTRQLTFESDPDVAVGVPRWSPRGDVIVFVMSRGGQTDLWVIDADGGGLTRVIDRAWGPCWSGDGQWIYYSSLVVGAERVEKVLRAGGHRVVVRAEVGSRQPAIALDGSALYYDTRVAESAFGYWGADHEILCARPEDGALVKIGSIPARRVPISPGMLHHVLSPDGRWLAVPLIAGATTNIWGIATDGSGMRPFTDFGDRSIIIARSVSWSCVGSSIYAAVAETESDIVVLDGIMQP
jgi:Tol biopolymer transport system component